MSPMVIPNDMTFDVTDGIAKFMQNWQAIADYYNLRQPAVGTLANRPAPGQQGAVYLATDVVGGTIYLDDGSVWQTAAAGVLVAFTTFVPPLPYVPIYF